MASVPKDVLEGLGQRYIEQPALTIDQHNEWLAEKGYIINRSSLHRYLRAKHSPVQAEPEAVPPVASDAKSIRLGCLMVAATYALPGDKVDLIRTAENFVGWVNQTAPA
ncbi:hypothetical protein HBN76_06320 [Pseudomonas sp. WS 5013]|uniref:hypothetical protein n=1 Tax=Pseudomonas sp. WS 5013 TaxID=2717475 RepID=UPI001472E827|nr:hypothetical protein [Pseudomonas sp. WS 5013]NMY40911.1 hypothetical protein [Pseudomonas sp. WS 5013]